MANAVTLRIRVDFGPHCSVGIGKIEILEEIIRTGSLSEAARHMKMSYRRAWLLLEDMNLSFNYPVARASVGGRGGGGVIVTPFGKRLVTGYRQLEIAVEPLATKCLGDIGKRTKPSRLKSVTAAMPVKGQRRAKFKKDSKRVRREPQSHGA